MNITEIQDETFNTVINDIEYECTIMSKVPLGIYDEVCLNWLDETRRTYALHAITALTYGEKLILMRKYTELVGVVAIKLVSVIDAEVPDGDYIFIRVIAALAGNGRNIIEFIERMSKRIGVDIYLKSSKEAVGFYEKLGFINSQGMYYYWERE